MELTLYIQSDRLNPSTMTKVDLYNDEKVTLTMTLQDIRDIEKVRTDFSQPFTLPASDVNNKIFKHWYNPDVDGYNSNYRTPAIIELNHLPFKRGFITLNNCKIKNGQPEFWNVTFLGETVDLKNVISEDQLDQLSWLDSQGFIFTNNNASARQGCNQGLNKTVDGVTYNDAFIYPLIGHSVAFNYDSTPSADNYFNLYSATGQTKQGCFYNDLKPAIRVDLILKAIEERYNLTFSNDFFFTSATENLYLWLSRNKGYMTGGGSLILGNKNSNWNGGNGTVSGGNIPTDQLSSNTAKAFFQGQWCPDTTGLCGQEGCNNTSYECTVNNFEVMVNFGTYFNAPSTQKRQVRITYGITPASGFENVTYSYAIQDTAQGTNIVQQNDISGVQTIVYKFGNQTGAPFSIAQSELVTNLFFGEFGLFVESEESFEFSPTLKVEYYGPITDQQDFFSQGGVECYDIDRIIQVEGNYVANNPPIALDVSVIPTKQLPEMKVLDFLTGLFKTFNLTAFFEDGVTVVKTLDDFYASYNTWDLTDSVHADSSQVNEALPFSEIKFTYGEPKSILAQTFEQLNNRKFGELRYLADASKQGIYAVVSPFEHMLYERLRDTTGDAKTIQVGTMLDDNLQPSFGKPLLFYGVYRPSSETGLTQINWINGERPKDPQAEPTPGQRQNFSAYWMVSNANQLGTSTVAPSINLNFGSELNEYHATDYGGQNNSLFTNYYQNYIVRVLDDRNRLFAYKVKLPSQFLQNFKLSDRIIIGNREYLINKITADLTTGESSLELLNIF